MKLSGIVSRVVAVTVTLAALPLINEPARAGELISSPPEAALTPTVAGSCVDPDDNYTVWDVARAKDKCVAGRLRSTRGYLSVRANRASCLRNDTLYVRRTYIRGDCKGSDLTKQTEAIAQARLVVALGARKGRSGIDPDIQWEIQAPKLEDGRIVPGPPTTSNTITQIQCCRLES